MRTAASARIALAATPAAFIVALAAIDLRLGAGDERGQAIDAVGDGGLWLRRQRLVLRLRPMLAMFTLAALFAGLLLVALIGLLLAVARIAVAHVGLLLLRLRGKARLLPERREPVGVVLALFRRHVVVGTRLILMLRLVLAELLLRRGDQAEIMFGMLIVVFGGDGIAGRARIAGELDVFFGNVRGGAADLDVGSVGLVDPGQRILAAPVLIIVIPVAHPLLVLTVSHVSPLFQP